ncbi:ras-related protein M-Ras isoform X5 [Zalophus californianus]|uniref:Ras-related protein M-Ras isoform X5 n=1 Tax=Zalophus californianus TaxID=9704 RepID=A0A6P9FE89_ZALCA|nr:ras-related protein M-Ras isoform X5 [Zalophus californianus]
MGHPGRSGHSRAGGVQRHAGAVYAHGGWLPHRLLGHGQGQLRACGPLPPAHPARQGQRVLSDDPCGQQGRSDAFEENHQGARKRNGDQTQYSSLGCAEGWLLSSSLSQLPDYAQNHRTSGSSPSPVLWGAITPYHHMLSKCHYLIYHLTKRLCELLSTTCYFRAHKIPYIETSAKDPPLNVDKAFHDLVRVIRQQIPEKSQKKKKKTKWRGDRATGTHKLQCVIL